MKITVDKELCYGCGLCVSMCPDIFEMRNEKAFVKKQEGSKKRKIKDLIDMCGVQAIKLK